MRQFRQNEECGALEELEPIDENRRYDFNYQQVTHLPRKVQILPVSEMILRLNLLAYINLLDFLIILKVSRNGKHCCMILL